MNSLPTETTELNEGAAARGWIFYDADCRSCSDLALRFSGVFARRGFKFEPLQESWVQQALGLSEAEALEEMRVLMRDGTALAGADAIVYLAQHVWWMAPLSWSAHIPGVRPLLRRGYRSIAANRHCTINHTPRARWVNRWFPLIVLPLLALLTKAFLPAWGFMWTMAFAIFFGCKWLTLSQARTREPNACPFRSAAYLLGWLGMDAARFVSWTPAAPLPAQTLIRGAAIAIARLSLGSLLLFGVARQAGEPLLAGWIGMIGMILLLHFGLFDLVSLAWRKLRVDAPPIMNAPLRSTSVGEFWGRRWNGAFNQLAMRLVFRPISRRTGTAVATLCAFGVSGLVHELVISVPAGAGYGLPTAYFLLQGLALLAEHTGIARHLGLGRGARGWIFTMLIVAGPAFWLFHPPFVERVILPFMQTIEAL